MPDIEKLQQIINDRSALIESVPRDFLLAMDATQQRLFRRLQQTIKEMDAKGPKLQNNAFNNKLALKVSNNLRDWLRDAGYYESINTYGGKYKETLKLANKYFGELDLPAEFLDRDLKNLAKIRADDLAFLRTRDGGIIRETYNTILAGINENKDWRDLQDQLKKMHIDNKENRGLIKRYSGTYSNTAFAAFDRKAMQIQSERFDLDLFYFSGSGLKDSREWCIEHRGKVYTRQQVQAWQGQSWKGKRTGGSVWVYLGGYNCTDQLTPVTEEMAIELGYVKN